MRKRGAGQSPGGWDPGLPEGSRAGRHSWYCHDWQLVSPIRLQEVVSFLQDMEQQLFEGGGGLLSE